jgi:acetaldehyde dehydrogenase
MTGAAVIGSGNIGTDLMIKLLRRTGPLRICALAGIDPDSDGLRRAARLGVATTAGGVKGLLDLPGFADIGVVFDATSAVAHTANAAALAPYDVRVVDLTPAALGPFVVPAVNLDAHRDARAIETVGGAHRGKAVIILNPAEPPLIMRDTVHCLVAAPDSEARAAIVAAVTRMVADVAGYVPGYRLKQPVQVTEIDGDVGTLAADVTHKITVLLEVEGAGHYLPAYAGNLDIMTSAAIRAGERLAAR